MSERWMGWQGGIPLMNPKSRSYDQSMVGRHLDLYDIQ
jgi:hypothetical protein